MPDPPPSSICANCKRPLESLVDTSPAGHVPCPDCGSTTRTHFGASSLTITLSVSTAYEHIREIVTRHKWWLAFTLTLAGGSTVVGYFLSGTLVGLVIGLALALVGIWARGKVTTRERTITRSGPR